MQYSKMLLVLPFQFELWYKAAGPLLLPLYLVQRCRKIQLNCVDGHQRDSMAAYTWTPSRNPAARILLESNYSSIKQTLQVKW